VIGKALERSTGNILPAPNCILLEEARRKQKAVGREEGKPGES
jgi:hypothetical protein